MSWIPLGASLLIRETKEKKDTTVSGILLSQPEEQKIYTVEKIGTGCTYGGIEVGQRVAFSDWLCKPSEDLFVVDETKIHAQFI